MKKIRLGYIDYINCLPVYYAIEQGQVPVAAEMVKGPPTKLNKMFINGKLDITPISSIEFARNSETAVILPEISISADGAVESILLFSKVPVTELDGLKVSLPTSSATSVVLLKILFEHYYHVEVQYSLKEPNLKKMLRYSDAALLIGDDALLAREAVGKQGGESLYITDLGSAWKEFTGHRMIYALWVINRKFIEAHPEEVESISNAFIKAKEYGFANIPALIDKAHEKTGLPQNVLKEYFDTIKYGFGEEEQKALLTFYDYAYKSGLIEERVKLNIWGEEIG
ncbi:menaquinone biosynthetic enzyme MqnA/MqnD family protein [Phosphitispora sp. TUW77]|uniref:menaquinone biosynthetic enzyme MqnA/MqnD family protein n=1 Tax=Phosphitispora sp. TUW77 TaxID=3152361 RepID=UPI003AB6C9B8